MIRLFRAREQEHDLLECQAHRCLQRVPQVEPDPDKERMREALRKLDVNVDLLRRGDENPERD